MNLLDARETILSANFFEDPVEKINGVIDSSGSKRTILYGPKGGGKSIVLSYREYKAISTPSPAIYTHFDACGKFRGYDDWFVSHYYELEMARNIILYIKKYYRVLYESRFLELHKKINSLTEEIDNYFRNHSYKRIELSQKLTTGVICTQLLDEFKTALSLESTSLLINRFDSTECSSAAVQNILGSYFDLFDQVVISVDDESISENPERRIELVEKGYSLIPVDYGKDLSTVKKIVELYVANYNAKKLFNEKRFPIELLTDEMYELLIARSGGNISNILVAIRQAINGSVFDSLKDIFTYYFDCEDNYTQEIKAKRMGKPIKFHL